MNLWIEIWSFHWEKEDEEARFSKLIHHTLDTEYKKPTITNVVKEKSVFSDLRYESKTDPVYIKLNRIHVYAPAYSRLEVVT